MIPQTLRHQKAEILYTSYYTMSLHRIAFVLKTEIKYT